MKYAIVESGGKQYKAVAGETIDVDRLPVDPGDEVDLVNVLMLVDGENVTVGTPMVDGIQVSATVVEHVKGPKLIIFKYSPKKRIRVKKGHRQQYTRLMIDSVAGEKAQKVEKAEKAVSKPRVKKEVQAEKAPAKKETKEAKAPAKSESKTKAKKSTEKKPSTKTAKK